MKLYRIALIKLCVIIILLALTTSCNSRNANTRWLTYLTNHISSCHVYQVLLLHERDENSSNYEVDNIIGRISAKVPTWKITFAEATDQKSDELSLKPLFYNPQATSLIVIIVNSDKKQLQTKFSKPIRFLTKLSEARSRPKCLLIFLKRYKQSTYEKLLRQMWSRGFLDTTLLEIFQKEHDESTAKIYNFNPFTASMITEGYKQMSNLLPIKTRNLHGYPINVDLFDDPPVACVSRNRTGHVEKVFGTDVAITKILSEAMNFKILWTASNDTFWELPGCAKNESIGALYRLAHNKVQIFATQTPRIATCEERLFEWSTSTKMTSFIIAVPYIVNETTRVSSEWKFHNFLIVISFLLLSWIMTRIMNFHQHNWRFPYLVQIMFGLAAPLEPQRLVEKIVLGSMLLTCILNSTFIYTAFSEVILQKQSPDTLRTIQDVTESRFQIMIHQSVRFVLNESTNGNTRRLLNKAVVVNITYKECLDQLIQNKSIACIVADHVAHRMVQTERDESGQQLLYIGKESLRTIVTGFPLGKASPFKPRISDILLRLSSSGVLQKIYRTYSSKNVTGRDAQNIFEEEKIESIQVWRQLVILLVVGYFCSCLAFLCEILGSVFWKKGH